MAREILKESWLAVNQIELRCPCGARPESLRTHPHVVGCPVAKLKDELIRLAPTLARKIAEERLACIHAMCGRCKAGEVPERINKPDYIPNFDAVRRGDWIHRETAEYNCSYCSADKIHELGDS